MNKSMGVRYVSLQFTFITLLFILGDPIAPALAGRIIQALSMLIGLWALLVMKRDTFRVRPEPKEGASLITNGPYRWIRHPMYTAIIFFFMPTMQPPLFWWRLLFFALLILTLLFKIEYEERLLSAKYSDYVAYKKSSYRLIPFLY